MRLFERGLIFLTYYIDEHDISPRRGRIIDAGEKPFDYEALDKMDALPTEFDIYDSWLKILLME